MDILNIKFKTNEDNDELEIVDYFVSDSLKQKFNDASNENVVKIRAKLYSVTIDNIIANFRIEYARYISCQHSDSSKSLDDITDDIFEVKTNLVNAKVSKKGNMPKHLDVVMKTSVLCVINLNWIKLSRGENIDFDDSLLDIPVEFVLGKNKLNQCFKLYFHNQDNSDIQNNQFVTIGFQIMN